MKKSLLIGIVAFTVVLMALFLAMSMTGASASGPTIKTGYIDNKSVFEEFEGKKEREAQLLSMENSQKYMLDSLTLLVQNFEKRNPSSKRVGEYKQQLAANKMQFDAEYQELSDKYTSQVWAQLNQYIEEYGKEEGYTLIHGGTGTGTVMYVDSTINITQNIIDYVNQRYQGK